MAKVINLKFPARCADPSCGAELPAGTRAKWYGRGKVYGFECHSRAPRNPEQEDDSQAIARYAREHIDSLDMGAVLSAHDKWGVYTPDGTKIGSTCGCIDYPCCGH